MIPYIHVDSIELAGLPLGPFPILVVLGVVVGVALAIWRARKLGLEVAELRSFVGWILGCGFIGAHVLNSVLYNPSEVLAHPWLLLELWNGLSSFGGFLGAALGAIAWKHYEMRTAIELVGGFEIVRPTKRERPRSVLPYADVVLAVFPVAWAIGRAGCAIVHDHLGARASTPNWLAVASGPGPVVQLGFVELRYGSEPRYDLGLLEMLFAAMLATGFALSWRRRGACGWYIVAASVLYAPVRFALEYLRVEEAGDLHYGGLTPAQWGSALLFGFGTTLAWRLMNRPSVRARANRSGDRGAPPR